MQVLYEEIKRYYAIIKRKVREKGLTRYLLKNSTTLHLQTLTKMIEIKRKPKA